MEISKIIIGIILFINISIGNLNLPEANLNKLIVGHWKSNTVGNFNAEIDFYKNLNGKLKWGNGVEYDFKYDLKDSVLTLEKDGKLTKHLISKLNRKFLKFKLQSNSKVKHNTNGSEYTSKEIQIIEMLEFSRIN